MQSALEHPAGQVSPTRYETVETFREVEEQNGSSRLAVGTFHPFGHITVAVIHLINQLHTLDGPFLLGHLLVNKAKVINDVLFHAIHLEQLAGSRGKDVGRKIEHPSFRVAFPEQIHRAKANVWILPRSLKFGNGVLVVAKIDKHLAELETNLEIGRIAFNAFLRIIQEKLGALGLTSSS